MTAIILILHILYVSKVQKEIKLSFAHLTQALHDREKQLLRQSEALYRQQVSLVSQSQEVLSPSIITLDERNTLEEQIKQFGRIELTGSNSTAITNLEPYKIQEYQDINKDHVSFDKSIKNTEIISSDTELKFSSTMEDKKAQNASNGLKTFSVTNLTEKSNHIPDLQIKDSEENLDQSSKIYTETEINEFSLQTSNVSEAEDGQNSKNTGRNIIEEQQNSYGHPEQVQQWLDQILQETEIEPTIHEVDKLPEYLKYQRPTFVPSFN